MQLKATIKNPYQDGSNFKKKKKLNTDYNPAILLMGTNSRVKNKISNRYLHTHVLSSVTHNSQKAETTQVSFSR